MKVTFCTLYLGDAPLVPFQQSLEACLPVIEDAGWEHNIAVEANCPYISAARSKVLKKAIDAESDVIVFLDYDLSWTPESMLKLLETEGEVVAGTYRQKSPDAKYMGVMALGPDGGLIVRPDGCIKAEKVPAGFLKLTKWAVSGFAKKYPELLFGDPLHPELDMFNHGAINGIWYGEDYAFSKRWVDAGGDIWVVPDLDITHHRGDESYPGNFHKYLLNYNKPKPILSNPLVSVVIPAYNYARYLGDAIESALMQTYDNVEIIVVDDGSTDNTRDVAVKYPVTYIYQANQGSSAARNTGIDRAKGEWIVCLDADDKLKPTYIEECLQVADADIISTAMQEFGDSKKVHTFKYDPSYWDFCYANQIHCASLFRKSVWETVGGFDTELHSVYDDWEFWVNATKHGFEVKTIKKPLFLYRKHGVSMISQAVERHDELYSYICKKHNIRRRYEKTEKDVRPDHRDAKDCQAA